MVLGMSPVPYTATGRIPYGKYTVTCRTVSHPLPPFFFAHQYGTGASTAVVRLHTVIRYKSHIAESQNIVELYIFHLNPLSASKANPLLDYHERLDGVGVKACTAK
jgi:hypothetical protein